MVHRLNKGKGFERDVVKLLSKTTGKPWFRVPMSGGYSTSTNTTDPRFKGDVYSDDPAFGFIVVECKNYASLNIQELFNNKSKFYDWIIQTRKESLLNGAELDWILFIKITNVGIFCVVPNTEILHTLNLIPSDTLFTLINLGNSFMVQIK